MQKFIFGVGTKRIFVKYSCFLSTIFLLAVCNNELLAAFGPRLRLMPSLNVGLDHALCFDLLEKSGKTYFANISNPLDHQSITKLKVRKLLGRGTFGCVFLVEYQGNTAALKIKIDRSAEDANETKVHNLLAQKQQLEILHPSGLSPKVFNGTDNYLLMEYLGPQNHSEIVDKIYYPDENIKAMITDEAAVIRFINKLLNSRIIPSDLQNISHNMIYSPTKKEYYLVDPGGLESLSIENENDLLLAAEKLINSIADGYKEQDGLWPTFLRQRILLQKPQLQPIALYQVDLENGSRRVNDQWNQEIVSWLTNFYPIRSWDELCALQRIHRAKDLVVGDDIFYKLNRNFELSIIDEQVKSFFQLPASIALERLEDKIRVQEINLPDFFSRIPSMEEKNSFISYLLSILEHKLDYDYHLSDPRLKFKLSDRCIEFINNIELIRYPAFNLRIKKLAKQMKAIIRTSENLPYFMEKNFQSRINILQTFIQQANTLSSKSHCAKLVNAII